MYDHHVELTGAIIDRLTGLPAEVLDQPIELPVEGIDTRPSLRALCEKLVRQLEMWVSAVEGAASIPAGQISPAALRGRLARPLRDSGPSLRTASRQARVKTLSWTRHASRRRPSPSAERSPTSSPSLLCAVPWRSVRWSRQASMISAPAIRCTSSEERAQTPPELPATSSRTHIHHVGAQPPADPLAERWAACAEGQPRPSETASVPLGAAIPFPMTAGLPDWRQEASPPPGPAGRDERIANDEERAGQHARRTA
jgi:hypothetical protein